MSKCLAPSPATGARASERWLLGLADAVDPAVSGGKAAGLARLLEAGFPVPDGVCLTTDCWRAALHATDVAARVDELAADVSLDAQARRDRLAEIRHLVEASSLPAELVATIQHAVKSLRSRWNGMLAVRSSALLEDHADASHAGIHVTFVGQYAAEAVVARVKACWASLWTERAWLYRERVGIPHADAAMAVLLQRFVAGGRAGVAFSADPMTADHATIVIEAAWGTGEAVVAGALTPDHYRVTMSDGQPSVVLSELSSPRPVLSEAEVRTLARLVKRVERALGVAADVEWAYDGWTFWVVQGRPIRRGEARRDQTLWTRANLKEVFPDQPSPLALSYLSVALNRMFREYNSAQGYEVPANARLVGVFRGRPYLNLTLMNQMTVARGGRPEIVSRLFGGATPPPRLAPTASRPIGGLRHGARLARELLTTVFLTPRRAQRLFRTIRRQARTFAAVPLAQLDDAAMHDHLIRFANTLLHRATLRRLHEIVSAQSRAYMILERLLSAWIPAKAERLLTQLMTGLGTLPNARLTYRLMALGAMARTEPRVEAFLASAREREALGGYRAALAGSRFLAALDHLLGEFGHRGPFESDVMSPRFSENPEPLLRVIQAYLRVPALESPDRHEADRRRIRQVAKREAHLSLRADRPWSTFAVQWMVLSVVCTALQRLLADRDENRHVTTLLVAHLRRVALEIGHRAARDGRLAVPDDVFFVLWDELPTLLADRDRDWRPVVAERRREQARYETVTAPDLLQGDEPVEDRTAAANPETRGNLMGFGVSPGTVTGTVKLIRSAADLRTLGGEIAVLAAIEPSLASIFPVVSGLVAEIGGVLSHAAILAREYGLPAVVNVKDVMRHLHDGDRIELNGTTGRIRLLGRESGAGNSPVAVPDDQRGDHEPDQRAGDHV
jgi:rifampicin phosphotransferase